MYPFEGWIREAEEHHQKTGRPLVSLCYAQSLDGSITARRGQPLKLSGPESTWLTHRLRAMHDAILVGIGTVLADNPRLNVRLVKGDDPQPVILDSRLRIPMDAEILRGRPPWIVTSERADREKATLLEGQGAHIYYLPENPQGGASLPDLLNHLANLGVKSLMVEGGARVITRFLSERLADLVVLTIAPVFIGGQMGVESILTSDPSSDYLAYPRLRDFGSACLGDDLVAWGRLAWPEM
jgi:3,4-dihydroxy 2-butanone 4-phosphate synthase/GTP cyclohydrolase II